MAMSHGHASCRDNGNTVLRTELASLYARRLTVQSTIRELESWKRAVASPASDSRSPAGSLEFFLKAL